MRKKDNGYYYNRIYGKKRIAYKKICKCFKNMEPYVDVEDLNMSMRVMRKLICMVLNDHPEIFWVSKSFEYSYKRNKGRIMKITPVYYYSHSEMLERKYHIEYCERIFLDGIDESMSEYDKAVWIHDRISNTVMYDKKNNIEFEAHTIYGALVSRSAVCEGYAKCYQYLLKKSGIHSLLVEGKCKDGELHGWNIVCIKGHYVHVDVTWDAKSYDKGNVVRDISHIYFGLTDKDIRKTRRISKMLPVPTCNYIKYMYFMKNHAYIHKFLWMSKVEKIMKNREKEQLQIRFSSKAAFKRAKKQLFNKNKLQFLLKKENKVFENIHYILDKPMCSITLIIK